MGNNLKAKSLNEERTAATKANRCTEATTVTGLGHVRLKKEYARYGHAEKGATKRR
uniref:MBF1 domain-containing protein n=1 Tax=Ascaris lumbricoides TaxID=6252 RepID=A0A0M3I225_ASCLU